MFELPRETLAGTLAAAAVLSGLTGCGGTSDITLPSAEARTPYRLATYRASDAGDGSPRPAIVV